MFTGSSPRFLSLRKEQATPFPPHPRPNAGSPRSREEGRSPDGRRADCYLEMYVYVLEGERVSFWALGGTFKKSQIKIVSS